MIRRNSPTLPALRWTPVRGYGLDDRTVVEALERGVPGFILFGGTAAAAHEAARVLEARAGRPLLLGADLERGAGQQFDGATALPPLAALGALDDLEVIRAAGALTGREALAIGVPWVFAPVADLDLEPDNPIVGTRAFGSDPARVAAQVEAWVRGCLESGAIPCVKHFPGHGRTRTDSHVELPLVHAGRAALQRTDLVPFQRAVAAGVPSIMTAHVAYPALDPSGRPATRSSLLVQELLRNELGFRGVVVTDALIMEGVGEPEQAVVEAMAAGVDLLLYPPEELDVAQALLRGVEAGVLDEEQLAQSRQRVEALTARCATSLAGREPRGRARVLASAAQPTWASADDGILALSWAGRCLRTRGGLPPDLRRVRLTTVDDDQGGPYPPPERHALPATLRARGMEVTSGESEALDLLCVYAEPRGWKGRSGLSLAAAERVSAWWQEHRGSSVAAVVFGGPRVLDELPPDLPAVLAWGGEPLMQEAVGRFLAQRGPEPGFGRPGEGP